MEPVLSSKDEAGKPGPGIEVSDNAAVATQHWHQWMRTRQVTLLLAVVTLIVLVLSVPGALRHAFESGNLYLFSRAFLDDIPKRLSGPGRFRFVLQPLMAVIFGIRSGRSDAREGRAPYFYAILFHRHMRRDLLKSGFQTVINLILMGILVDAVCQWIILGRSHPGAALLLGPVLIVLPYSIARAVTNRVARMGKTMKGKPNSANQHVPRGQK